ncbi:DUF4091 domain-containing protein [Flavobacteriaceae bacterium]|nr:DUF4091 domain-containing protein [Flavobacteriaceae bacterium]MDA9977920.1 DUF4091 domain-containing protein [Flavobacteriaceae bacterium]MDB4023671.1 DUF4091 domain-containing protein [Flavobacteriaceae bacterium]MDB4130854.1 DUF4091 domain-containing protein [Flavobacteriaceae bacterium]
MNINNIKSLFFLTIIILVNTSNLFSQYKAGIISTLQATYPDKNNLKFNNTFSYDIPQNSDFEALILIRSEHNKTFTFNSISKNLTNINYSIIKAVPVEENTGVDSRTEQFLGQINHNVIRRAPFEVFEVIQPLTINKIITTSNFSLLRISVKSNEFKSPGSYKLNVILNDGFKTEQLKFKIKVHDASIPRLEESKFFYTNWFNLSKMEEMHNLLRWNKEWFTMLDKYAKLMAEGRQNCIIIPHELISVKSNKISLDEEKMISFINVFKKYGFKYFESPHLLNRGANDDWGNPELKTKLRKRGYYSEEGKKEIDTIIRKIKSFTKKYNLENQWLQHIADEPTDVNAQCYKDVSKQIKSIYPEITIMEATNAKESLSGSIDLWCPLINDFQENQDFFNERESKGEKILIYTCLVPGGKWLNRTLDMERIRQVYFGWAGSKYNTFGYLHWGLNQYKANPFKQSVVKHPSPQASSNNFLPAGDTHVIYPGTDGPLSSLRFEAHRKGIEDYELLEKLKTKNIEKHSRLIKKLFFDYTNYSLSIKKYKRIRKKLLKSI